MQAYMATMPVGGDEFYETEQSGSNTYYINHYLENLDTEPTSGAIQYDGHYYDPDLEYQEVIKASNLSSSPEDHYEILGFTYTDNVKYEKDRWTGRYTASFEKIPGSRNEYKLDFYYTRNDYNITFISGGEVVNTITKQYEADISSVSYTPTEKPTGMEDYSFVGWYDNEMGLGDPYVFQGTMPAKNITLYAEWAPVTYTVEFDLNGALGNIDSQTLQPGEKVEKPADPVRDGYQFGGWLTQDGEPYDFEQGVTHDMTLVAQWISEGYYTVTYTSGEGAGTPPSDLTKYAGGAHAQVAAPTTLTPPEKKVFLGWKVKAGEEDTGLIVQPGDWIEVTANMVLVAQWGEKPEETQVIYKLEGGNYDGKTDDVVVTTHNNGQLIVMEAPKKPGYEFTGWLIQGTETIVQPGATIQVDNTNPDGNVLIAQWEANSINITIEKVVYETPVQSFIFKITGANNFEMAVVMNPEDFEGALSHTVTICDLPAGNYTVTEDTKWSWKYTANVTSQGISETGTVTFTNTRNDENWLGGSDSAENHFDPVSSGSSDQTIDTLDALVPPLPTGEKKQGDGDDQKKSEPEFDGDPELDDGTQEGGVNHV